MNDFYQILGVSRYASGEEIKTAYRVLAKRFHPDLNPGDTASEERFKELSRAYETLSDPLERKKYDFRLLYGAIPLKTTSDKEVLQREMAKRKAFDRHKKRKEKEDILYRKKAVYAGISILIIIVIGLNLSGETSLREQRLREFVNKNHDEFLVAQAQANLRVINVAHDIQTADSPYDTIFGEGRYADLSDNSLIIKNRMGRDVITCLVEHDGERHTIRNEFIHTGDSYNMAHLPDGTYNLRLYVGKKWNPGSMVQQGIKGAFTLDTAFFQEVSEVFRMRKIYDSNKNHFSTCSITLTDSSLRKHFKPISASEFFK